MSHATPSIIHGEVMHRRRRPVGNAFSYPAFCLALPLSRIGELSRLGLAHNRGAAFSFLSDASGWQRTLFIAIAALATAVIVAMLLRHSGERLFCAGLALILGGALGNLWDRIALGYVVDFLDFHAFGWHFWAFNLADSAITVGAGLLILDSLRSAAAARKA